jgi:hypothetical protein
VPPPRGRLSEKALVRSHATVLGTRTLALAAVDTDSSFTRTVSALGFAARVYAPPVGAGCSSLRSTAVGGADGSRAPQRSSQRTSWRCTASAPYNSASPSALSSSRSGSSGQSAGWTSAAWFCHPPSPPWQPTRLDPAQPLLAPLIQLLDHFADGQHQCPDEHERAGEEPDVGAAGAEATPATHTAHRHERGGGVTGEDVRHAHPAVGEQPTPV